jgi:hypothetical protein
MTIRPHLGLTVAGSLALALVAPAASEAGAADATRTLPAHYYAMPPGDHLSKSRAQSGLKAAKLHFKLSAAKLAAVKRLAGDNAATTLAPEQTGRSSGAPTVVKTCTTNSADVFTPSDINGAVSPTHIVSVTNDAIGVYRVDGCSTLSRVSLEDFVGSAFTIPDTQEVFDPRVIYDKENGRFVMTAETFDDINFDQFQYIAVSTDATASAWYIYQIALSEDSTTFCKLAAESFWDYPMLGSGPGRWFITANDFPDGEPDEGNKSPRAIVDPMSAILTIDKTPTLSGAPITVGCFNSKRFNLAPPLVIGDAAKSYFLSTDGLGSGKDLAVYSVPKNAGSADTDTLTEEPATTIQAWSAAPNARQPNGQRLDTLDGRFQGPSIQAGNRLWNVHTVNVRKHARWRLYRLQAGAAGLSVRNTITASTTSGDNDNLFNPSVATRSSSSSDPAFVTFTRTIPTSTTTKGYAAMLMARGPNASSTGWTSVLISRSLDQYVETGFRAGSTKCNDDPDIATCRWGDYSSTQIDPTNSNRAWGFNQLIIGRTSKNWTTKGSLVK